MNKWMTWTAGALVAGAVGAGAYAQTDAKPAPQDGQHMREHHGDMRQRDGDMRPFSRPTERVEARLAYLKTALKITDAQQPQWEAFAARERQMAAQREQMMKQWRDRMQAQRGQAEHRRPGAIERMERAQQMHADAVKYIGEMLEVEKPLYASLSGNQRMVADALLAPRGPGMFHHGHDGHGEHGDRGGFERG